MATQTPINQPTSQPQTTSPAAETKPAVGVNEVVTETPEVDESDEVEEPEETGEVTEEVKEPVEEPVEIEEEPVEELEEGAFHLNVKEVKEKYPEIFKEFPNLKRAIFHGRQMLEEFPSVEEAREAKQRLAGVDVLETNLLQGDSSVLLDQLVEHNKDAAFKFIEGFLPTVKEKSSGLYARITLPVLAQVLQSAASEGKGSGNTDLYNAAFLISHYISGKKEILNVPQRPAGPDPEKIKFEQERQNFYVQRYNDFKQDVWSSAESNIRGRIQRSISDKVPENLKDIIEEKIYQELGKALETDRVHMAGMSAAWKLAAKSGLSSAGKAKIVNAYLGRAVTILPQIRQKHLSAFTNGSARGQQTPEKKGRAYIPQSASAPGERRISAKDVDWSKTTTEQYLMGRDTGKGITLKKK